MYTNQYDPHNDYENLRIYLRQIGKVKLLTPDEEKVLGRKIQKGDEKAREEMIKANLLLVISIAYKYEGMGFSLMDMIGVGNIALIKAVERFDPARDTKFSPFGYSWIGGQIKNALSSQSRTIRIPNKEGNEIRRMRTLESSMEYILGRKPTDDELALHMDVPVSKVSIWKKTISPIFSIDRPLGNDGGSDTFESITADERAFNPFEELVNGEPYDELLKSIDLLHENEAAVIRLRFGLDGKKNGVGLVEIASRLGISAYKAGRLQRNAIRKLRKSVKISV